MPAPSSTYRTHRLPPSRRDFLSLLLTALVLLASTSALVSAQTIGHLSGHEGVTLEYEVVSSGDPTLVFVHGWMCDRTYWREQRDAVPDQFGVVLLDLGGHGRSSATRDDWSIDGFAEDVAASIHGLDLQRVILVGHSMGGPVIAEAAQRARNQVIGLVGVDTYQYLEAPWLQGEGVPNLVSRLSADFEQTAAGFVRRMFPTAPDSALFHMILAGMTAGSPIVGIPSMQSVLEWYRDRAVASLNVIDRPIWTINSAEYVGTDVAQLHRLVPDIEVRLLKGVGHFVMLEDPESFNRSLIEAIRSILAAGQ